ncbi:MAG TPA: ABC transporter substrate-binding protein [Candidatus Acidoferrales bacterium]|nr:ABC transporter substrate-binding protein [Candidatus Acidoferrales bacterium]
MAKIMDRRQFLRRGAALGLGAVVGASVARVARAASRDRVVVFQGVGLDSLHPYAYSGGGISGIWQHVIEPLIEMDFARGEYAGVLAESWELQGNKWVFRLRKGVRFHDGSPFTSKDVLFSVDRMINDKKSLQGSNFREVIAVEAPDDHTVTITTKKPNAVLLERLNNRFIVSKAAVEKSGNQLDNYRIGTGPYKLVSWQRDGNLVLARNDDYWRAKAEIREAIFRTVKEEAARVAGLLAGQADVISNLPIEEIERVERHPRTRVEKVQGFRMYFLAMNVTHKPFDNKLVRQAFSYSVDPQAIVKHIYEGNGYVLNGPLASNMIGYDPDIRRYPYDPKKARELLAKAGFPGGLDVKLHLAPDRHLKGKEVCQVIARQLSEAGIRVELVSQEYPVYWGRDGVNGGKLAFYYAGRSAFDADTFYDQYFRTGVTKRTGYSNPEFDRLIEEEQQTGNHKKRIALLQQAGRILMEDAPFVPLYTLAEIYGLARNVAWTGNPNNEILVATMRIRT